MRRAIELVLGVLLCSGASAQPAIPDAEALALPTPERLAGLHAAAQAHDWKSQSDALRAAALRAYEHDKLPAAMAWYNVYGWSLLFGEDEAAFVTNWIRAIQTAQLAHPNMPPQYPLRHQPLARLVSPDLQAWLLRDANFSDKFFSLLQPVDYLPRVFEILDRIYRADPSRFRTYANLALAIAVVYDVPPPPDWPHSQVSATTLPRRWPDALEAFNWWSNQDRLGHTYQPLSRLPADELKFVVDAAAPFSELEWAQKNVAAPLSQLESVYSTIRYRHDRAYGEGLGWSEKSYSLETILAQGGICADQTYFATEVGKARGVPTLYFHGADNDSWHAWFGFLDGAQHWQLNAGRYGEQRFVTGFARDPQTWRELSDHEVRFLTERFHTLPSFIPSRGHTEFAVEYLRSGDASAAVRAARKAVGYERRNQAAWEVLLAAETALGLEVRQREATIHEAMRAFESYPDLEAYYSNRLSGSLRARGETSAAEVEETRIVRKYQGDRDDLSILQARNGLLRAIATKPVGEQVRTYNLAVDHAAHSTAAVFYEQVVVMFVQHLVTVGERAEARRAAERARAALASEPGSALDQAFAQLLETLKP